jgi:hypothetical protein
MVDEKVPQLAGVDQAFLDANQERFDIGAFRVRRAPTRRTLVLPLLDEGPIEEGEPRSIVANKGVMLQQPCHGRLVKDTR